MCDLTKVLPPICRRTPSSLTTVMGASCAARTELLAGGEGKRLAHRGQILDQIGLLRIEIHIGQHDFRRRRRGGVHRRHADPYLKEQAALIAARAHAQADVARAAGLRRAEILLKGDAAALRREQAEPNGQAAQPRLDTATDPKRKRPDRRARRPKISS